MSIESGVVPSAAASPAHWAEVAVAAEWLASVARRVADDTGDQSVREISAAAEDVAIAARVQAYGAQR